MLESCRSAQTRTQKTGAGEDWLTQVGRQLTVPGEMVLIGSGGLLWHAFQQGVTEELPENSMDVDPVTDSDEVARICYEGLIGSDFEREHGWHIKSDAKLGPQGIPARLEGASEPETIWESHRRRPFGRRSANTETKTKRSA